MRPLEREAFVSRTYTIAATAIYGGRRAGINYFGEGFTASNTKRVGWYKDGSTDYAGAVSIFFNSSEFTTLQQKAANQELTIQSIKLNVSSSDTFAYKVPIFYNVKANSSTTDWSQENYAYNIECPKNGKIPEIDISVSAQGLPDTNAYVLIGYYRTYSYVTVTSATLTVVTDETSKTITYNANGGTNAPSPTVLWATGTASGNVTTATPTRTGYSFAGWNTQSNGSGTAYASGAAISISADITLYAQWTALKSVINSASNANIGSSTTVNWTNYGNFTNKVRFIFGSVDSGELAASGSSHSYTLPASWYAQIPNATSGTATVYLYTYVDGTLIGTSSTTFTASVPSSIIPSIGSVSAAKVNDNTTVRAWEIYLQDYSKVTISASGCAAGAGATITGYTITGQSLSYSVQSSAASASATSDVITVSGTLTYTVKITDSRGRSAQRTVNISVTAYAAPNVSSVSGVRCNSDGTINQTTGTSIKASATFTWSAVGSNALTSSMSYKKHIDAVYTTARTGLASGTSYVIAVGLAEIASSYDVQVELTDSLGNTATYVVVVPPVVGIGFGLKNDRARFGGPVEKAGLQVDWPAEFNGVLTAKGGFKIGNTSLTEAQLQSLLRLI